MSDEPLTIVTTPAEVEAELREYAAMVAKIEQLEQQNAVMVTDLEQGFMQGAYARLKHLQETERRYGALTAGEKGEG
jgi:hypothetical protein